MRFALRMGFAVFVMASPSALAAGAKAPLQIVVSREQQSLVVYDGDTVVATSKVSTGKAGHATPTGIFSILEKRRRHESNIYSNAPIAVHAAAYLVALPCMLNMYGLSGFARLRAAASKFAASLFKMTATACMWSYRIGRSPRSRSRTKCFFQPSPSRARRDPALSDVPLRPAIGESTGAQLKSP